MDEKIVYLDSGKVVGKVVGDTFIKNVKSSKHFLQKPPAIAFDMSSMEEAERLGAMHVRVFDKENKTTYSAPIARVWQRGFSIQRGFGSQVALRLTDWDIS